jgi:FKBP-type peptidyl-prolyl cis-trans isomerase SlyD
VTAVALDSVTLDANHPLAGQKLVFDVEIATVRDATKEEVAHGHAHGEDGQHQH